MTLVTPDNKTIAFMAKSFGDAFEKEQVTGHVVVVRDLVIPLLEIKADPLVAELLANGRKRGSAHGDRTVGDRPVSAIQRDRSAMSALG